MGSSMLGCHTRAMDLESPVPGGHALFHTAQRPLARYVVTGVMHRCRPGRYNSRVAGSVVGQSPPVSVAKKAQAQTQTTPPTTDACHVGGLPYMPLLASPTTEMWSLELLLYRMLTGHSLVHTEGVATRTTAAPCWRSCSTPLREARRPFPTTCPLRCRTRLCAPSRYSCFQTPPRARELLKIPFFHASTVAHAADVERRAQERLRSFFDGCTGDSAGRNASHAAHCPRPRESARPAALRGNNRPHPTDQLPPPVVRRVRARLQPGALFRR